MPENEFEKQVQKKLDGLKFDPSVEVWQNVAAAVAKRKKDRRGVAIILLALLLVGVSFFMLFNYTSNHGSSKFLSDKNNAPRVDSVKASSGSDNISIIDEPANTVKQRGGESVQNETDSTNDKTNAEKINDHQRDAFPVNSEKQNPPIKKNGSVNKTFANNIDDVHNIEAKPQQETKQKISVAASKNNPVELVDDKIVSDEPGKSVFADTSSKSNDVAITGQLTDSLVKDNVDTGMIVSGIMALNTLKDNEKDTALITSTKSAQKSKWQLGFNFSFGATTTGNEYLGVGSGNNDISYSYNSPATGNNSGQVSNIYATSTIQPGIGFKVGLFAQKNISAKTKILFALNYRMYNSVIINASEIITYDTAGNGTTNSSNGSISRTSERYNNNFHFLELPIALQFKLTKQNKLPVYLHTGISIAQLLGSNAPQNYTSSAQSSNVNERLNKTQFNLSAGLLISLSRQAKNPFLIGPDLSFSLSKIANAGLYKNSHYGYLGIMIQKTIGKK